MVETINYSSVALNLATKAASEEKSGSTCTLPPWECEVNFHAGNTTGQASQLSSQNVNPVTQPPVHLTYRTYGCSFSQQPNVPIILAFLRKLVWSTSEFLSKI